MAKEDIQQPPKQRALSPREEAMNAVAQTRNAEFEKETGIKIEANIATIDPDIDPEAAAAERERALLAAKAEQEGGGEDDTQLALQKEQADREEAARIERENTAQREAEAATQRAQTAAGIDPKAKYTFKVNGQDTELSGDEVLRRVQKDASADLKLEQASQTLREAQELQRSLQAQQQAQADADAARAKGGNPDGVVVDPDITKKFTSALFKGDEASAAQAFQEAVSGAVRAATADNKGRGNAIPVDPSAIATQVRQQIAIDSALERSKQDYPDMYADPDIEAVAATKIQRKVGEGIPFVTALDEVQTDMAKKFGWKPPKPGTPKPAAQTDRRDEKLARKESLEQTPSGPTVKSTTHEEPVATVHDTIRDMARQRGQSLG